MLYAQRSMKHASEAASGILHALPYAYLLTHSVLCLLADTLCLMPPC
jgi:hypothetical protein